MPNLRLAIVHLDESCLGNGREGSNPGGAGGLIEIRARSGVERRDIYLSEPATTNNRMALRGAIHTLEELSRKGATLRVLIVSDSLYLVKGMREWVRSWKARGWTRKGGPIGNLELWKSLDVAAARHVTDFRWVRGHAADPKNEYADHLSVRAAGEQMASGGLIESGFLQWLDAERERRRYAAYDPDLAFAELERQLSPVEA